MFEFQLGIKCRQITFDPDENLTEFLHLLHVANAVDTHLNGQM